MLHKSALKYPKTSRLPDILIRPFQEFTHATMSSGVLLLLCTIIALLWANGPFSHSYHTLWEHRFIVGFSSLQLNYPLHVWINDGFMAFFFLLVGLEIKREMLVGELSQIRQAVLPLIAALGGAIFPALLYTIFTWGTPASSGWGIPMATDIAFALGVLALLGKHIPLALKVFLTALAIVDDLLAVLTIALFYSHGISWPAFFLGSLLLLVLLLCNLVGIRRRLIYFLLGFLLWLAIFASGLHAAITGILVAWMIPVRSRLNASTFIQQSQEMLATFARGRALGLGLVMDERQQAAIRALEVHTEAIQAPLQRIEHALHIPVRFAILPLFVLANAGVTLTLASLSHVFIHPVCLGILIGLLVGKQLGILLFSWSVIKLKWAQLPTGITWKHIYGIGWLGGIGFTMSLFIADLAFGDTQSAFLEQAKVAILLALLLSSVGGFLLLRLSGTPQEPAAHTIDHDICEQ
ncbi:Na+/H+ antiporter NhaA [Ktedonospora formicarum]|uniref:Na(+)/H(+) antiporter NhaA n=1 Tax=Ktedonospora formicarum TaxID=2778364 RepID=A0A8J3MWL3_9CHLR|nr:Na+/H+ antiporter NhaA [Ktedonospora formicarum]GHO48778.1 Na(+)/H(+) antiporter NhaA [Ktedonospora formicarum]